MKKWHCPTCGVSFEQDDDELDDERWRFCPHDGSKLQKRERRKWRKDVTYCPFCGLEHLDSLGSRYRTSVYGVSWKCTDCLAEFSVTQHLPKKQH